MANKKANIRRAVQIAFAILEKKLSTLPKAEQSSARRKLQSAITSVARRARGKALRSQHAAAVRGAAAFLEALSATLSKADEKKSRQELHEKVASVAQPTRGKASRSQRVAATRPSPRRVRGKI
jgi:hypothetical protein